jgi:hypothetical protein
MSRKLDERVYWLAISMLVTGMIIAFALRAGRMSGCRRVDSAMAVKHGRGAAARIGLGSIACMLTAVVMPWSNVFPRRSSPEFGVL